MSLWGEAASWGLPGRGRHRSGELSLPWCAMPCAAGLRSLQCRRGGARWDVSMHGCAAELLPCCHHAVPRCAMPQRTQAGRVGVGVRGGRGGGGPGAGAGRLALAIRGWGAVG